MTKHTFIVQPQRSDGRGYIPCELHRATSFAVLHTEHFQRRGRKFTTSRVIGRYGSKREAEGMADHQRRAYAPTPAHLVRKLGRRIVKELTK